MGEPIIRSKAALLDFLNDPETSSSVEMLEEYGIGLSCTTAYWTQRPYYRAHANAVKALERSGQLVWDSCCYRLAKGDNKSPEADRD